MSKGEERLLRIVIWVALLECFALASYTLVRIVENLERGIPIW